MELRISQRLTDHSSTVTVFTAGALIISVMAKGDFLLDPFHAPRWTALAFLSALVWLRMATSFRDNRERSPFSSLTMRSLLGLLAVYGLCNVLSLSRMESQAEALWSLVQNGIGSLFLLGLAALAMHDVTAPTKQSLLTYFGPGMVLTGIAQALLALADAYGWMESPFESGWGPAGWSGNRNLVAGFQVLVLPWSFLGWIPFSGLARKGTLLISAFAVALGGAVLGICQSRASLLAILLGLVWSVGLGFWRALRLRDSKPPTRPSPTRWIPLWLWILFALGFLSQANRIQPETQVTTFEKWALSNDPSHASHTSVVERLALWKKTLGLIADHPVLGVGVGQWKIAWASQGLSGLPQQDMSVMHTRPHNDWLWVFSEIGLLGGTAYILIPLLALFVSTRAYLRAPLGPFALGPLCLSSGVVAYVALASFDFPRERAEHSLASMALMAFAFASLRSNPSPNSSDDQVPSPRESHPSIRKSHLPLIAAGMALLSLCFAAMGLMRWRAENTVFHLMAAHLRKDKTATLQTYGSVPKGFADLSHTGAPLAWYAGLAAIPSQPATPGQPDRLESWRTAESLFNQATDLHPNFIHAWNDRATAQLNLGDTLAAINSLQSIRKVAPGYAKSMFPLAWLLHTRGHTETALGILDSMPGVDSTTEEGRNRDRLRKALTGSQ